MTTPMKAAHEIKKTILETSCFNLITGKSKTIAQEGHIRANLSY